MPSTQYDMKESFDNTQETVLFVADYTCTKKSTVYMHRDGLHYVVSDTPPDPPFVVAVPDDMPDVILERLKRLATCGC